MLEKLREIIKRSFSNSPKAKIIIGITTLMCVVVTIVTIMSIRKTLIISIDGKEKTFVTYKGTVKEVLQENGIDVGQKDKLQPSLETKVYEKGVIMVKKAVPIQIVANETKIEVQTAEDTIKDVLEAEKSTLNKQGIEFDENTDEISAPLDSKVEKDLSLQLTKVELRDVVEKEKLDFDTIIEKDKSIDKSVKKVKTEGIDGEKEITYSAVYKDGVEISRKVKSTKTIAEPQNKIIVEGTSTTYVSRGGENISPSLNASGKKSITCSATAYSGADSTASGKKPGRDIGGISTIAVDPSVIPLGSKVYVDGYGYAIAADTGSSIKGNKIDLYFNSHEEACNWGLKIINLTIVAYPGEW